MITVNKEKYYTITYKENGKKEAKKISMLVEARKFGREMMQKDAFISLTNSKKTLLPL